MLYLDANHQPLPEFIAHNGTDFHIPSLIATGETALLATLGAFPHAETSGPAPLGYTAWVESAGVWTREPAGTQEERDAALLATARTEAHTRRMEARVAAEVGGFTFSGHPIDSDRDSILRITNAATSAIVATLAAQPWSTVWQCKDYAEIPVDAQGIMAMQAALAAHGQACHTHSREIEDAINAAESVEAVLAIDITTGWPS